MKNWLKKRAHYIYSHLTPPSSYQSKAFTTGISTTDISSATDGFVDIYTLQGICIKCHVLKREIRNGLALDVYIAGGKKSQWQACNTKRQRKGKRDRHI